jgi:hypothetical protein
MTNEKVSHSIVNRLTFRKNTGPLGDASKTVSVGAMITCFLFPKKAPLESDGTGNLMLWFNLSLSH